SVGNIISPSKISPSLVYLQNVEKIFNLKYPISTRAITINDLRSGQRTVSGHGFSFTESATSSITISNSQKIRGYLSTGLGVDLINSGNSGSGIVAYSNGIIFCSIFESLDIVLNTKSVEVRCTER
ncbi:MAG: hypothetical protein WCO30_02810, partial [bacterium]